MAAKNKPNEIAITRIYDAPVKMVWEAFTEPKHVAKWWGPRGFTLTTHSKDLRPGGHWAYTMHGPDGVDYENKTIYHVVEPLKKLVYDHGGNDDRPPLFRVTVLFTEIKGKTKMEMTMALKSAEAARETKKFVKMVGGNSTWDRLAEYLEKESSGRDIFVINRSFEASIQKVFQMFVNPESFSMWLPPVGMTMKYIRADIREGGISFYKMTSADASMTLYNQIEYLRIQDPSCIIYRQSFCDQNESLQPPPFGGSWPVTMLTRIDLNEEENGDTRVTVTWSLEKEVSPEELATFVKERGGMAQGWTGSMDKLENLLAEVK